MIDTYARIALAVVLAALTVVALCNVVAGWRKSNEWYRCRRDWANPRGIGHKFLDYLRPQANGFQLENAEGQVAFSCEFSGSGNTVRLLDRDGRPLIPEADHLAAINNERARLRREFQQALEEFQRRREQAAPRNLQEMVEAQIQREHEARLRYFSIRPSDLYVPVTAQGPEPGREPTPPPAATEKRVTPRPATPHPRRRFRLDTDLS